MTTTGAIPAGWYPDPRDAGAARWWNGIAWGAETRVISVPTAQPVTAAQPVAPEPVAQPVVHAAAPPAQPAAAPAIPVAPPWVATASGPAPAGALPSASGVPTRAWHGSPNTVGIWLLAFAPLITNVVVVAGVFITAVAGVAVPTPLVFFLPVLIAEWVFAGLDRSALGRRGFAPPSLLWMLLLPPLVYLIARGRAVRAVGAKAWPPELAYFLQIVLIGLANVALATLGTVGGY